MDAIAFQELTDTRNVTRRKKGKRKLFKMHFRLSFAVIGWLVTIVAWFCLSSVLNSFHNHSNCNFYNEFDADYMVMESSSDLAYSNDNEIGELKEK